MPKGDRSILNTSTAKSAPIQRHTPKAAPPKVTLQTQAPPKLPIAERNAVAEQAFPTRFDALNEAILMAEAHLRTAKPLHDIWHEYRSECDSDGNPETMYYIGFQKYEGKWRLLHSEVESWCPSGSVSLPLTDCPIDVRVRASQAIPLLYEKIVESKEEFIKNVDGTIALLKSFAQQK